ncbi:mandelate racemase/muconate lactonizing enzyme family protein [Marinovum sp. 2_MG-2023]|uniref:mandelate racemase/muconate lactonizing enzyme family protein n=1 Tax=unclassified Marinovum TaxID=2647166 RepID=UPI0026E2C472|nr:MULTISPECIES: mandelate racemase/muconate lactonizing enzyme family protein [unclassified Marinovum]MDO6732808.1 mandelate racemase/muconate lactonizing enzyme family protein [Marinovum sp. 2_MG-2023]MDO6782077.1 mandelate racemase/muconate lactonizing enzyme family protein [Marinovum sp. 1_MG-2023]
MPPRLTRAQIFHFRHMLKRPIPSTMGPLRCRPALLLRLEDSEGAFGWGEIWCNFPPDGDLHRARLAANVLPAALDDVPLERAFGTVAQRLHRIALQAGEPGPVSQIAAAVDIALHDLAARRAGQPLARYLGANRLAVPAYASGISPDAFEDQIATMRAKGYLWFKQRVGFGRDDSLPEAEAAARGLHSDEGFMLDANQAWDVGTAIASAKRLAPLNPVFLEEPLPADAPASDWAQLAADCPIPLAAGENLRAQESFDEVVQERALSVLQPDLCKWGGISGCLAVARAATAAGQTYWPHYLGGGIGLMASAHLLAAVGGTGRLEVDSSENPLLTHFTPAGLTLDNGQFPLPDAPGLGFDPDIAGASDLLFDTRDLALTD